MDVNSFIFSDKTTDRIRRHLLFWFIWWVYFAITHAAAPFAGPELQYFANPAYTSTEAVFLVLAQMPLMYATVYYLLPKFILKQRYWTAALLLFIFWIAGGFYNFYVMSKLLPFITKLLLPPHLLPQTQRTEGVHFLMAVMSTYKGAFTITAAAFMFKFAKYWYEKTQRNIQLQLENSAAQLQLLTAQVHPHFLFNTLNNIYSQAQNESPKSAEMIMGLSDMLRYILYEGHKELVPLEKELQLIIEYMQLEEVRYGNKLQLHYRVTDKTAGIMIAPLILLPFVENCFKHGASHMLENPWINFTVEMNGKTLIMKLLNAKKNVIKAAGQHGIGINNVKQRLSLLYPGKHELKIRDEEDVFIVDLKIVLDKTEHANEAVKLPVTPFRYA